MNELPKSYASEEPSIAFYEQHGNEYVRNQREFYSGTKDTGREFFRNSLAPNIEQLTIADVGCGAGDDAITYKQMGAARVIGIEPSKVMLDEAKKSVETSGLTIELQQGKWDRLPLPDESVDAITARYSFHVVENLNTSYKEVARVLKKGGVFLVGVPHPIHDEKVAKEQNLKPGEKMKVPLFHGKFTVDIPPHTMDEYLSDTCKQYFEIEEQIGYSMHEDATEKEPTGLLLKLRKI
jgi:ubiquinone/menaquinone biosynthesis C-methylase UbiE